MTTWCANRLSNRLSKGLRGFMGGPEGGAVCRPQPVNRRFRVSRYLARKSDPLCRHNVCYQSTYVCYPAVDSALDGQGVCESVLHSVACGTVWYCVPYVLPYHSCCWTCVCWRWEKNSCHKLLLPHGSKPDHTPPSS